VNVVTYRRHPVWKDLGVHNHMSPRVSLLLEPAIIYVHIVVTQSTQAKVNYTVRIRVYHSLVYIAVVLIPSVPAHRWGQAKAVLKGLDLPYYQ
jgi:hypothetical protein